MKKILLMLVLFLGSLSAQWDGVSNKTVRESDLFGPLFDQAIDSADIAGGSVPDSVIFPYETNAWDKVASNDLTTGTSFSGDVTGAYNSTAVGDDSHNHTASSISGLSVSDFTSPNISNWTNNSGYLTQNQSITLSGDVTGSGTTTISTVVSNDSHTHNGTTLPDSVVFTSEIAGDTSDYTITEMDSLLALAGTAKQKSDSTGLTGYATQYDLTHGNIFTGVHDYENADLEIPNSTADKSLDSAGAVHFNTTDEQLSLHSAADGEISGEVSIPLIQTYSITFDPKAVCDGTIDALYLFQVGDDFPEGITIDEWKISFSQNPTTELDADLSRASAIIGQTSEADIDALDTTDGVASEDTDANINGGSVVANGQYIYIEFVTAYTAAGEQIMFQMWYHGEED